MNRIAAGIAGSVIAAITLVGCAAPATGGSSVKEACAAVSPKMAELAQSMLEASQTAATDPVAATNMLEAAASGYGEAAAATSEPSVKAQLEKMQASMQAAVQALREAQADATKTAGVAEATTQMQSAAAGLTELCQG